MTNKPEIYDAYEAQVRRIAELESKLGAEQEYRRELERRLKDSLLRLDSAQKAYRKLIAPIDVCDGTKEQHPVKAECLLDLEDALFVTAVEISSPNS